MKRLVEKLLAQENGRPSHAEVGEIPSAHAFAKHGLVFASPSKGDFDLSPIEADLADLGPHVVYERSEREVRGT